MTKHIYIGPEIKIIPLKRWSIVDAWFSTSDHSIGFIPPNSDLEYSTGGSDYDKYFIEVRKIVISILLITILFFNLKSLIR